MATRKTNTKGTRTTKATKAVKAAQAGPAIPDFSSILKKNGWKDADIYMESTKTSLYCYKLDIIVSGPASCYAELVENEDQLGICGHFGVNNLNVSIGNKTAYSLSDLAEMETAIECAEKNLIAIGIPFHPDYLFHGSDAHNRWQQSMAIRRKLQLTGLENVIYDKKDEEESPLFLCKNICSENQNQKPDDQPNKHKRHQTSIQAAAPPPWRRWRRHPRPAHTVTPAARTASHTGTHSRASHTWSSHWRHLTFLLLLLGTSCFLLLYKNKRTASAPWENRKRHSKKILKKFLTIIEKIRHITNEA